MNDDLRRLGRDLGTLAFLLSACASLAGLWWAGAAFAVGGVYLRWRWRRR